LSLAAFRLIYSAAGNSVMPEAVAPRLTLKPLLAGAAAFAVLLAATALLWAHYGTTVFFETIRAGFVACFG
jgi:hypothetical protein